MTSPAVTTPPQHVAHEHVAHGHLARQIGLYGAIAIVMGSMIGSGIFRSPASIASHVPDPTWMLLVWVIGGAVVLCGALTLAELGSRMPQTGGIYVFIRDCWGPFPAFLFGWAELVLIRPASTGAIAMTCAEYGVRATHASLEALGASHVTLAPFTDHHMMIVRGVAIVAVLASMAFNVAGARSGARVQTVLTSIKVSALVLIIVTALGAALLHLVPDVAVNAGNTAATATAASQTSTVVPISIAGMGLGLVSVLWVYDGWADLSFVNGEVKDPERTVPRALIGGTIAVIGLYLLANLAYLAILPVETIANSPLVAADVIDRIVGKGGVLLVGGAVAISTFGTLAASMLTGPRILWATANDGLLFRPLAFVSARSAAPVVAIVTTGVLGIAFILIGTFERLADAFVTSILPFYALAVAAIFVVRRSQGAQTTAHVRSEQRWFRAPGYPITPIIFIVGVILLLGNALIDATSRIPTLIVFGVIAAGTPFYYWMIRRRHVE